MAGVREAEEAIVVLFNPALPPATRAAAQGKPFSFFFSFSFSFSFSFLFSFSVSYSYSFSFSFSFSFPRAVCVRARESGWCVRARESGCRVAGALACRQRLASAVCLAP